MENEMEQIKKTPSEKMGIKKGAISLFINAPDDIIEIMQLPELYIKNELDGEIDYIHFFVKNNIELCNKIQLLKEHLSINGMLWVSWPKGGKLGTDISLQKIIKSVYEYGLVESTTLSINKIWSAIKFTYPKKGKIYKNSYGKLESRTKER
jgi:hypothetical protein